MIVMARLALVDFGVSVEDAYDQVLTFHPFKAVTDLVLVRHEQRIPSAQCDGDLNAGETPAPAEDDPPDRASHAAASEHKFGDGLAPCRSGHCFLRHEAVRVI
jgi:hypothetical protein